MIVAFHTFGMCPIIQIDEMITYINVNLIYRFYMICILIYQTRNVCLSIKHASVY